jgi:hypothetical protein
MPFRVKTILAVVVMFTLAFQGHVTAADPPPPPPLPSVPTSEPARPGDAFWSFAQVPPFDDSRIALAIAALVDSQTRAAGSRIFFVERRSGGDVHLFTTLPPAQPAQVPLLLAAAGLPAGLSQFRVTGPCRIWAAAPQSQVAGSLAEALAAALAGQGLVLQPCVQTQNIADADLVVWLAGDQPPAIPGRPQSFLTFPAAVGGVPPPAGTAPVPPSNQQGLAVGCGKSGPAIEGGKTTGLGTPSLLLEVTLPPAGSYFTLPAGLPLPSPPSVIPPPALMICSVETNSSVVIDATTGREISRTASNTRGNAILDQIVASARVSPAPGRPSPLRPPITGDAGLLVAYR